MKNSYAITALKKQRAISLFREHNFREAVLRFEEICRERPLDHESWMMQGLCLQNMGQLDNAITQLEQAEKLKPDSADIHFRLGFAYFQIGWIGLAIDSFRKALQLNKSHVEANDYLIKALLATAQYHEAIDACREAFKVSAITADLHCQLAVAMEQTHKLDEACSAVNEALSIEPDHVRANLVMAILDKREGNLEEARARLENMLQNSLPPVQYASLAAELGSVLDRMSDYNSAYNAFDAGNKALEKTITPDQVAQEPVFEKIKSLKHWFSQKNTQHWKTTLHENNKPPPIFMVGFPRSGTTLMEQLVASIPHIIPSDEKPMLDQLIHELPSLLHRSFNYPQDLNTLNTSELNLLRERYWELADKMVGPIETGNRLLDKMPFNIIDLGMIYRLFPKARIIVVLRDPRDCCLSCFMQPFKPSQTNIHLMSLKNSAQLYAAVMDLWLHYRSNLQLSFLEIHYEDIIEEFETTARRLIEFINEPWDNAVLQYFEHAKTRNVSTPSYSAVTSPIYSKSIGRWKNYQSHFDSLTEIFSPYLKSFNYK